MKPAPIDRVSGFKGRDQRTQIKQPLSEWGKDTDGKVQVYLIDFENCELGLVTNSAANFSYELYLEGLAVRLEATTVAWLPDMSEAERTKAAQCILKFHSLYLKCEDGLPKMALVKVKSGQPDFQCMEESLRNTSPSVPRWLPPVVLKMERLDWWETVRLSVPTEPPPSPMKLHMIFDEGATPNEEQEFSSGRKTLAQVGWDSLALLKAVTETADARERSIPSGPELAQKIEDFLTAETLAEFVCGSYLPYMGTRQSSGTENLAEMLLALVGAHKLESDMFSVTRLWTWLSSNKDSSLEKANANTAACLRYLGRTPSYMSFGEVEPLEEEKDGTGQLHLKVSYEEYDDAFYRWNGSHAEEKRPDVPGAIGWQRLVWDPILGTFCSPTMLLPDSKHCPLPNKICAWLRGRCITKLVSIKHSMEATPPYSYLKEEEVDPGVQEKGTMLIVMYKQHNRLCYCRSPHGGLGVEIDQQRGVYILSYSESKKTLLSQVVSGWALPRKVVTWLLEGRCLADLIPGRKKASADVTKDDQGVSSWTDLKNQQKYWVQTKATKLGNIYQVKDSENGEWEALTYSEERKEWLVNPDRQDNDAVVVPCEAISVIATGVRIKSATDDHVSNAPQKPNTPSSMKLLFPQLSGTDLAEIEKQIDYRFKQPRLLAEALTHCSASRAIVMSCELLAVVGDVTVRSFASDWACRREVTYSTGSTVVKEGTPACRSFCAPKDWPGWASTKSPGGRRSQKGVESSLDSVDALQCRLKACCNHVSYAHSCVRLNLHKAVRKADISGSEKATRKFLKRTEKNSLKKCGLLFQGGTPKVLGDVFLACVGAIVMDSDYMEAETILMKHCNECKDFKVNTQDSVSRLASESEDLSDGQEPGGEDKEIQKDNGQKADPEHEGAIYCRYCEMWLNGPTQWADHEIGKKHWKAVRAKR